MSRLRERTILIITRARRCGFTAAHWAALRGKADGVVDLLGAGQGNAGPETSPVRDLEDVA
jgi:hypothetical protein